MKCPRCHKTFLTALSVCPACGFEPSRFAATVTSSIEKNSPTMTNLASEMFYTAPLSEPLPELQRPTVLDFPNKNNEPEWKKKVRETVRNVQEKRREAETGALTEPKTAVKPPSVSAPKLNMELSRDSEQNTQHPLAAKALERIQKSRQSYVATAAATARKIEPVVEQEPVVAPSTSRLRLPKALEARHLHAVPSAAPEMPVRAADNSVISGVSAALLAESRENTTVAPKALTMSEPAPAVIETLHAEESPSKKLARKIVITEDEILESAERKVGQVEKASAVGTAKFVFGKAFSAVRESLTVEPRNDEETMPATAAKSREEIIAQESSEESIAEEHAEVSEEIAPLWMRAVSGAADLGLCFAATALMFLPFGFFSQPSGTEGIFAFLAIGLLVAFIYLTTMTARYATTLGKSMFSMSIVDVESGNIPSFQQAAISSAVYLLGLPLAFIGFLTVPFSAERRAAHDLAAKTIVIRQA